MLKAVLADISEDEPLARELAEQLGAEFLRDLDLRLLPHDQIVLRVMEGVPHICLCGPRAPGGVAVGFEGSALRHRRKSGHNELLGKAVGWKQDRSPRVLDVTAGYGLDSFLLSDLGCDVLAIERQPILALLLGRARERALHSDDEWLSDVASRLEFRCGDARDLAAVSLDRDVIYLDPMFPVERRASPGKGMQILQVLCKTNDGDDGSALLEWALVQKVNRVVVKRPRKAPPLGSHGVGHQITGKSVRFDVYPLNP